MNMRTYFYILMLLFFLSLVGGITLYGPNVVYVHFIGGVVEFLLFLLLGWKVFGKPVEG